MVPHLTAGKKLDAFDQWCLHCILRISWTNHPPLTHIICTTCLKFFDHTVSVAPLRHTRLQTIESDRAPLKIGLATAYHRVQNRQAWSTPIETAMSITGLAT